MALLPGEEVLVVSHRHARVEAAIALACAFAAAGCGSKSPPPRRTAVVHLPYTTTTFSNGLRLLVVPDPPSDLVHVAVRYQVGSSADPPGKAGLAHLVEHLTFLARPRGTSIESMLEAVALGSNAFTSADATHYLATARANQAAKLLFIEARRLAAGCESIPDALFARELAVVRNELRMRARDVPSAPGELLAAAYGEHHAYSRPVIGTDGELASMTRADACGFLRQSRRRSAA